jgi:hypothetical protein
MARWLNALIRQKKLDSVVDVVPEALSKPMVLLWYP